MGETGGTQRERRESARPEEARESVGRSYLCIDLKSFYASVECRDRGLDPLTDNLVVADPTRTDRTICLAVSPAMKARGVPGRCRVFELPKHMEYIMAPPRMQRYIDVSAEIYGIYLKYLAREDIHVYSIDEAFMDVTDYLGLYDGTAWELAQTIRADVLRTTGIPCTCGVGTNLYLAKIAMDLLAKRTEEGIAELDGDAYRERLWDHCPLTDFWRIGKGIEERLRRVGIRTMREIAQADEELLYGLFGVDAELLIDHAWGRESTRMCDIKRYRPRTSSVGSGQVLPHDTDFATGRLLVKEMADLLSLELVERCLVTDSVTLHVGYAYRCEKRPAHGTAALPVPTSSCRVITESVTGLYDRIVDPYGTVRRLNLTCNHTVREAYRQYDLFTDPQESAREHTLQETVLQVRDRYGKNAILRGMNLEEGARTVERNRQIGGHRADGEAPSPAKGGRAAEEKDERRGDV